RQDERGAARPEDSSPHNWTLLSATATSCRTSRCSNISSSCAVGRRWGLTFREPMGDAVAIWREGSPPVARDECVPVLIPSTHLRRPDRRGQGVTKGSGWWGQRVAA